jgi:subtilisin-like proprotein convertase family protein
MRFKFIAIAAAVLAGNTFANTLFYSNTTGLAIPDNDTTGASQQIIVGGADAGVLTAVSLTITFSTPHTQAGDLAITLSNGTDTIDILRRPGSAFNFPSVSPGDSSNLAGPYTFIDSGSDIIAALAAINSTTNLASGSYQATTNNYTFNASTTNPVVLLNTVFGGDDRSGTWTLHVTDTNSGNTGTIGSWSLNLTTASVATPEPATFALTGMGLLGIALAARRKRAKNVA